MAPRGLSRCHVCRSQSSKYSCPSCSIPYCSVKCYKDHKSTSCTGGAGPAIQPRESAHSSSPAVERSPEPQKNDAAIPDAEPLRALTSLKWPYVPEESSFPDPLKRDDPKALQLHHYQAIATSPDVRSALSSNPTLPALLRRLDTLRGPERENALESLLGVGIRSSAQHGSHRKKVVLDSTESEEDQKAFKQLAEAVEKAVRGESRGVLGLDWDEDS